MIGRWRIVEGRVARDNMRVFVKNVDDQSGIQYDVCLDRAVKLTGMSRRTLKKKAGINWRVYDGGTAKKKK